MNEPMETCGECRGTGIGERVFARGIDANGVPYAVREVCQSCHGRGQVARQVARVAATIAEVEAGVEEEDGEPVVVIGDREYRGQEAVEMREIDRFWRWADTRR